VPAVFSTFKTNFSSGGQGFLRASVVKIGFARQNKASAAAEASIKLAALLLGLCGLGCLGLAGV
jgi:hypothetical protein